MPDDTTIIKTGEMVEDILKDNPFARNSDKRLIYEILTKYYGLNIEFGDFVKFPSFETIRRTRQSMQAEGKYPPTDPEVCKKRGIEKEEYEEWFMK